jgi:DNA mismatch repair protein MutS
MEADKTTLADLSIFHQDAEASIAGKLNFCITAGGGYWQNYLLEHPLPNLDRIKDTQATIRLLAERMAQWPQQISNGTLMVIEKFYDYQLSDLPNGGFLNCFFFKLMESADYALVKYSNKHFIDFVQGFQQVIQQLELADSTQILNNILLPAKKILSQPMCAKMLRYQAGEKLGLTENMALGHFLRNHFKRDAQELMDLLSQLDAYLGFATAMKTFDLHFPDVEASTAPFIEAKGLRHLLLSTPVRYDLTLNQQSNFLFLTGANMAGKSTFIKAVGVATYLAHCGLPVPAQSMRMSLFEGLLSNIQVTDNLAKGESYFFNEVQRIKKTIEKINDGRHWLILIDELFKGTNVEDAMKCSVAVIKGLLKMRDSLFILSTHLYEIGEELKPYNNISFRYFETNVSDGQLHFSYQLKEGISNDRLGYLILQREKVVELLDRL